MDISLAEGIKIIHGLLHYIKKHDVPLPPGLYDRTVNLVGPYGLSLDMEPEAFEEEVMKIVATVIKANMPQEETDTVVENAVLSDPKINTRIVERQKPDGKWEALDSMLQLQVGDTFRMFEYNGRPVRDNKNNMEFKVKGQPYTNDQGIDVVIYE